MLRRLKTGGDQGRDGSDDKKKRDGKTSITDFFQISQEEGKRKQERKSKRAELKQKQANIQGVTDSKFIIEMQKIDAWEKAGPRTPAKDIEANALRSRVAEVNRDRSQANSIFEDNLKELDRLAERDDQRGAISKTFKKAFSEEMGYDEQLDNAGEILRTIQIANTTAWENLEKEMLWKRERHDKTNQIEKRENTVTTVLASLAARATESSRSMLSNIDEWEEIGSHGNIAETLRGQVTALYNHYDQTSYFLAQQRELAERPFSNEQKRANDDLTAREDLLTAWEQHVHILKADYERAWNELHQRIREPVLEVLEVKQIALRERPDNLTRSIGSYSETEAQKIDQWEFFGPGNRDERASLANTQKEKVSALHDFHTQGVQAERASFERALQNLNRRQFSNEDVLANRDITEYRNLLNTWNKHIDTLSAIQQARRKYVNDSLALERNQPIVSPTSEGESELNRGTRDQRIAAIEVQRSAMEGKLASLTANIRAYYRSEVERPGPVRERVRALRDLQSQDVQTERANFEQALQNLGGRRFSNEDILANRDIAAYENLYNTWQEHIDMLDNLHMQEQTHLSASLALEQDLSYPG
jgi:hypothetical protein